METTINISKFWTRIWALIIDSIILGVVGYVFGLTIQDFLVRIGNYGLLFGLAITVVYQTIGNSTLMNGQTLGKRIMNIQVVDIEGNTVGIDKSLLRALLLCFPYFTANLTIPGISDIAPINIIKTLVLSCFMIGIVVLYIFNKQTRQSLHDLIVGTFVVTIDRKDVAVMIPKLTKTPFYIYGGLVVLFIGGTIFTSTWENPELENVLSVYSKVSAIDGVLKASVVENTTYADDSKIRSYKTTVWVIEIPKDSIENSTIVKDVAEIIINNASQIDSFNVISVSLIREFNIGIASQNSSTTISKTPNNWRMLLQR